MLRWIDLPPVWLAGFLVPAWVQPAVLPLWPFGAAGDWSGGALVAVGLLLIFLAAVEFRRHRTTIIPHQTPQAIVTRGVFTISRNPIYLADVLILTGLSLRWDSVLGLLSVPFFMALITRRFIFAEEARLREEFGPAFEEWAARVRRWI